MSKRLPLKQSIHFPRRCLSTGANTPQRIALKSPSYNTKSIVNNIEEVIEVAQKRELPQSSIDLIKTTAARYQTVKEITLSLNILLQAKNQIQKKIKTALKNNEDIESLKAQQLESREKEKHLMKTLKEEEVLLETALDLIPNSVDASVTSNVQIVKWLNPLADYQSNPKQDHINVGEELGIINMKSGSLVTGGSWYYLLGDGALLEQALVQHALSLARKKGFKMVVPPSIVKNEIANACGFKPRDQNGEQQTFQLISGDWCLTGTAEIPLAGLSINKTFQEADLPQKVVGLSRSYRAEAGARGKDTRGLYRVHEFTKVELFVWATEEQSPNELENLREFQESLIESLGLPAKVINMPFNDLGAPAAKKYDIEAWMPGRGSFGEVTSASNCLDYQSRRLNAKYRKQGEKKSLFVHTLNGTAMAVPRVIVAIIENFYDPETRQVRIPDVLRKYMDDKEFIQVETK